MELERSFTVPVLADQAWEVLLDVERVAPCMPGATLDSVEGDENKGRIKVKLGPVRPGRDGRCQRQADRHLRRQPGGHADRREWFRRRVR